MAAPGTPKLALVSKCWEDLLEGWPHFWRVGHTNPRTSRPEHVVTGHPLPLTHVLVPAHVVEVPHLLRHRQPEGLEHLHGAALARLHRAVHEAVEPGGRLGASEVHRAVGLAERVAPLRDGARVHRADGAAAGEGLQAPVPLEVLAHVCGLWPEVAHQSVNNGSLPLLLGKWGELLGRGGGNKANQGGRAAVRRRVVVAYAQGEHGGDQLAAEALLAPEGLVVGDDRLDQVALSHVGQQLGLLRRQRWVIPDARGQVRRHGHDDALGRDGAAVEGPDCGCAALRSELDAHHRAVEPHVEILRELDGQGLRATNHLELLRPTLGRVQQRRQASGASGVVQELQGADVCQLLPHDGAHRRSDEALGVPTPRPGGAEGLHVHGVEVPGIRRVVGGSPRHGPDLAVCHGVEQGKVDLLQQRQRGDRHLVLPHTLALQL
mmetsp:Transcript_47451/g.146880  ORF Transcript_47451/g.146880 Transcript_47451/m.146880 type:complete len:434 (-) Transcript_47451:471-1772(-)